MKRRGVDNVYTSEMMYERYDLASPPKAKNKKKYNQIFYSGLFLNAL